jgi:hypothetical protein
MSAFLDVLGKPASEVPENYERGETLIDTSMDLETNSSKGFATENTILLEDIFAAFMSAYGFAEHIVGLANTWSIPREELEDSSILL